MKSITYYNFKYFCLSPWDSNYMSVTVLLLFSNGHRGYLHLFLFFSSCIFSWTVSLAIYSGYYNFLLQCLIYSYTIHILSCEFFNSVIFCSRSCIFSVSFSKNTEKQETIYKISFPYLYCIQENCYTKLFIIKYLLWIL